MLALNHQILCVTSGILIEARKLVDVRQDWGCAQGREMEQSGIKYYREIMVQEGFKGEGDKRAR